MANKLTIDDVFLPTIFVIFVSSLLSVVRVNYHAKPSQITTKWKVVTLCLYVMSGVSFLLQLKGSWIVDFLHQIEVADEPVLWQRVLGDFILAHKLTLDTTENYWITSQLLLFMLSFVAFVNMYSRAMELRLHHILGYLILGLTGSYGGAFALFLVHYYNTGLVTPHTANLTVGQFCSQVASSILGNAAVIYLYDPSVSQLRTTVLPFLVTTFLLPFAMFAFQEKKAVTKAALVYFLIFHGVFIALHRSYMTYMLVYEWLSFRTMLLVAFGYPYQYVISVDLICCAVVSSVFAVMELVLLGNAHVELGNRHIVIIILKVLALLVSIAVTTFVISPGAMLPFLLAYREIFVTPNAGLV